MYHEGIRHSPYDAKLNLNAWLIPQEDLEKVKDELPSDIKATIHQVENY